MGFNTPFLVLNDALSDIEKSPDKFVDQLSTACSSFRNDPKLWMIGSTRTLNTEHADVARLLLVGGNSMEEVMSWYHGFRGGGPSHEDILKELAEKLGYVVYKKPSKKDRK